MNSTNTRVENNALFLEKLLELQEKLKPKKIIITSEIEVYEILLKQPWVDRKAIKFSNWVEGTYIVDLEKMNEFARKPMFPMSTTP